MQHPKPKKEFLFVSPRLNSTLHALLKYCTARSCFTAAAREENVPKFFRLPVFASFLREYKRYSPDCSFRIMQKKMLLRDLRLAGKSNTIKED